MKKIKSLIMLFTCLIMLFTITGCGNKKAINSEEFINKVESMGYKTMDATDQMSQYDYIEKVTLAINEDETYQIEFYELSDSNYATSFFNNNKQIFEETKDTTSAYTSVNIGNHAKYTLSTDGKYKVVSRIDNTVIYLNVNNEYASDVKEVLESLGY